MKANFNIHTRLSTRRNEDGSILVLALLIMLAGAFGLMAMVTIVGARAKNISSEEEAVKRRTILRNSRSLALDYLRDECLVSNTGSAAATVALADGWGSANIPAVASAPLASLLQPGLVNRTNPGNGGEFVLNATVSLSDGVASHNLIVSMKSRNPMLSGDLLTFTQGADPSGFEQGEVMGRTRILSSPSTGVTFHTEYYSSGVGGVASMHYHDESGGETPLLLSNFPEVPLTLGSSGSGLDSNGGTDPVFNPNTTVNSVYQKMVDTGNYVEINGSSSYNLGGITCNSYGDVNITLDNPSLKHVYLNDDLDDIRLYGQSNAADFAAAGSMSPVIIVIRESSSSARTMDYVRMINANNRPLILAIHSTPATPIELPLDFPDNETWRSLIYVEGTEVRLRGNDGNYSGRTAALVGGIQADDDINVRWGMELNIEPEISTDLLETLSPRFGWTETYLAP